MASTLGLGIIVIPWESCLISLPRKSIVYGSICQGLNHGALGMSWQIKLSQIPSSWVPYCSNSIGSINCVRMQRWSLIRLSHLSLMSLQSSFYDSRWEVLTGHWLCQSLREPVKWWSDQRRLEYIDIKEWWWYSLPNVENAYYTHKIRRKPCRSLVGYSAKKRCALRNIAHCTQCYAKRPILQNTGEIIHIQYILQPRQVLSQFHAPCRKVLL